MYLSLYNHKSYWFFVWHPGRKWDFFTNVDYTTLMLIGWQCQYYSNKRPLRTCVLWSVSLLTVLGGFEAGMVFAIRVSYAIMTSKLTCSLTIWLAHQPAYHRGNHKPVQFFGIMSSISLSVALLWVHLCGRNHHTHSDTSLAHNITKYTNIVKWLGSLFCSWSSIFLVDCSVTYPSCSDRTLMSSLAWHIHLLWHVPVLWCSTTHVYLICLFCQGSWCYCDHTRPDTQPSGGTTKAARACPQLRRTTHWTARGEYQTYPWREERNGSGIMLLYMIWMVHATSGVLFTSLLSNEGLSLGTWTPAFTQPSRKFIGRQLFT